MELGHSTYACGVLSRLNGVKLTRVVGTRVRERDNAEEFVPCQRKTSIIESNYLTEGQTAMANSGTMLYYYKRILDVGSSMPVDLRLMWWWLRALYGTRVRLVFEVRRRCREKTDARGQMPA